jgi:hypothetical protein
MREIKFRAFVYQENRMMNVDEINFLKSIGGRGVKDYSRLSLPESENSLFVGTYTLSISLCVFAIIKIYRIIL